MTKTLWSAKEAAAATGGRASSDWSSTGVSIDTRSLQPGDLFIALKGPNHDAHAFVAEALARGAAAALVSERPADLSAEAPLLIVEDTQAALEALGRAGRARSRAKVLGVTGSAGKTGTKEALAAALSAQGKTHWSVGSFNNHWGVPLTLARLPQEANFAVVEMGMNHSGELAALTQMVRPHVAIVTTIAPAHMAFFDSLEAIAEAKAEIFQGLPEDGVAVINRDIPQFALLAERAGAARVLGFGRNPQAFARLIEAEMTAEGSKVRASLGGRDITYRVAHPGKHWVMNSLAVLAAVSTLGGDLAQAAEALANLAGLKGRGARYQITLADGGAFDLIDESYNANPSSMRAALEVLSHVEIPAGGRRIAVLGDMLELGATSAREHRDLAAPLAEAGVAKVYTCGAEMKALFEALPEDRRAPWAAESATLARRLATEVRPGDCVLVKGSAGARMGRAVEALLALDRPLPRAANGE